jgi:hypothetical protein
MKHNTTSTPIQADWELLAGVSQSTLAETGEVEIAGSRYPTPRRLARLLDKTTRTLARWDARRIGPPRIKIGKTVLYDLSRLPGWLASQETHPARNTRH